MNCQICKECLPEYVEGLLEPRRASEVQAHLASCPACRGELEGYHSVQARLRDDAKAWAAVRIESSVMDRILREQVLKQRKRIMRQRYGIFGIGLAAAIALAIVSLWPGGPGNRAGIAWADVAQQIKEAKSAHLVITVREKHIANGEEVTIDCHLKTPDKLREVLPKGVAGKATTVVANGGRMLTLFPDEKLYALQDAPDFAGTSVEKVLNELLLVGGVKASTQAKALIGGATGRLVSEGIRERDGRKLIRYRLEITDRSNNTSADEETTAGAETYYWLDPDTQQLAFITLERRSPEGKRVETSVAKVELNADIPDSLFSLKPPADYHGTESIKPKDSVSLRSPGKIRDLYTKYEKARNGISRYRLIVWEEGSKKDRVFGLSRTAVDGKRCRIEEVRDPLVVPEEIVPAADMDAAWKQLDGKRIQEAWLTHGNRVARIRRLQQGYETTWARELSYGSYGPRLLSEIGWPSWPSNPYDYQWMPPRADRPGLIGIRAESDFTGSDWEGKQCLLIWWLDPAKDHLCVSRESYTRLGKPWHDKLDWQPPEPEGTERITHGGPMKEYDNIRVVTECGQTPEGRWHPKAFYDDDAEIVKGKKYRIGSRHHYQLQVDTKGPLPDELFAWPSGVPQSAPAPGR